MNKHLLSWAHESVHHTQPVYQAVLHTLLEQSVCIVCVYLCQNQIVILFKDIADIDDNDI